MAAREQLYREASAPMRPSAGRTHEEIEEEIKRRYGHMSAPVVTRQLTDEERLELDARIEAKYGAPKPIQSQVIKKGRMDRAMTEQTVNYTAKAEENVGGMSTRELIELKGLKGKIAVSLVESVDKAAFLRAVGEGKSNVEVGKIFGISATYVSGLRKLWDCQGERKRIGKKKALVPGVGTVKPAEHDKKDELDGDEARYTLTEKGEEIMVEAEVSSDYAFELKAFEHPSVAAELVYGVYSALTKFVCVNIDSRVSVEVKVRRVSS